MKFIVDFLNDLKFNRNDLRTKLIIIDSLKEINATIVLVCHI